MKGAYVLLLLLPIMTVGGVISINALSPAEEAVIVPASMLPNSAAKDLSF
ncbi:hypothetical protein ACDX66_05980 [Peribacillus frigoritolerans]